MWVWIPRYAYSIPSGGYHTSTATEISIEFMKGTSNETATGRTTFQNASGAGNWNIHPAFNYGEIVSGLWVAKFEASNSSGKIMVQPGVSSWRDINVNDIYTNCLNYNKTLNSHMMKNDEWGAVAYLSKSKYGKNDEVEKNDNSSYYTGGGTETTYLTKGTQSTTGNPYGIYDLSGNAYEYIAGYYKDGNFSSANSAFTTGVSDQYSTAYAGTTDKSAFIYGDATYETRGWFSAHADFVGSSNPFFERGGIYYNASNAGVFDFNLINGNSYSSLGFRMCLAVQ